MKEKKVSPLFKIIKGLVRLFYPKTEVIGAEKLPEEPAIIVGNHAQMHGPIVSELYFPGPRYTWCAGEMMTLKEVPDYAFEDFWSEKPKLTRWFYKLLSYIIAPVSVCIFNNADTIPVYHDIRFFATFRETVNRLLEGARVIIFPEYNEPYNHILYCFQDKFIDIAKRYHKKTGKELSFVPMYIAPKLKKIYLGDYIRFDSSAPIEAERRRICDYLMTEITNIACSLPEHTVIPYGNIPKKRFPTNIPKEVYKNEKTGR